jgi:hypothetical protein
MIEKQQIRLVEKDKVVKFINSLPSIFSLPMTDLVKIFTARPKDIYFLAYDSDLKNFATSLDGTTWTKISRGNFSYLGHITVPERGSIWQSRTSKALFLVIGFVNTKSIKDDEIPSIVYMDELGSEKVISMLTWHSSMMFSSNVVTKEQG